MEKSKLFRNVTILGLIFGLAVWMCFYSNLIFKNTQQSFPVIAEILFALLFTSFLGVVFGETTKWFIKRNKENIQDLIKILNSSIKIIIFLFFILFFVVLIPNKIDTLIKVSILWTLITFWPLCIYVWSREKIFLKKSPLMKGV